MQEFGWGVIGCGEIANVFAVSLKSLNRGRLVAGASRTPGKAEAFAKRHTIPRSYSDYDALLADPEVDIVYISTTHNFHFECVKQCLEAGKHVLCEKPFTINAEQTRRLAALAKKKNLFVMEALWTRFLPAILKLQELIASGEIGTVETLYTNFCLGFDLPPEHRMRNIDLAGGALLDLGIYPISMADIIFGEKPSRFSSFATMDRETGVDEHSHYVLEFGDRKKAVLSSSYSQAAPKDAIVSGTKGYIRVPDFLAAQELHIHKTDAEPEVLRFPYGESENFKYEIAHVMDCVEAGLRESNVMPLSKTLEIMELMDAIRKPWKLVYPGE